MAIRTRIPKQRERNQPFVKIGIVTNYGKETKTYTAKNHSREKSRTVCS